MKGDAEVTLVGEGLTSLLFIHVWLSKSRDIRVHHQLVWLVMFIPTQIGFRTSGDGCVIDETTQDQGKVRERNDGTAD